MLLVSFFSLMLAAAAPSAADADPIKAFVSEVYGPYFSEGDPRYRPWSQEYEDRPLWSAQTTALFKTWRVLPKEADSINDEDWLCDCQAQDGRFEVHILSLKQRDRDHASVEIKTENGTVGSADLKLSIVREGGRWRLDDVYSEDRGGGLKAALRGTIAEESPPTDPFEYHMEATPEEGQVDPVIQKRYSAQWAACQERARVTYEHATCFEAEFVRQDAALNQAWKSTLKRMPSAMHGPLLTAQRKWVAARDPFCRADSDGFKGGTIAPIVYVDCRVELTIRRTIWLEQLR
jgi:uncharacterized protein YecT (DUF1311 family)